ncbi:hypothetical protein P171DRAFT_490985 [Karstenula rhodostoma CBS 690.94]|uniref:Uncharacterized protein n=1 Tax=Karstenula rhodostoma CBS 690.94 TaxID=1392251 RepID=A0A9P4P6E6_9PLEO|nr:hypothetical protein P171DRAFT_490985 [Karstenula rhodostoma CBS 690.94]
MASHDTQSTSTSASTPSPSTPTPTPTTSALPKSSTTLFTTVPTDLLPRSATSVFTAPVRALTTGPRAVLTLFRGLKHAAKAIVRRRKKHDPMQSRMSQIMHEARLETPEEIDEWEEVDTEDVKEDMRRERLRMKWERKRKEREGAGVGVDNDGDEGPVQVFTRRRKVRHWDDESESDGEVIEII